MHGHLYLAYHTIHVSSDAVPQNPIRIYWGAGDDKCECEFKNSEDSRLTVELTTIPDCNRRESVKKNSKAG